MNPEEVQFLRPQDIVAFHDEQVSLYGGATGILSEGQLLAAATAPLMVMAYEPTADLFDLAAAYAYHLCQAHAFADGNKRTAFLAAMTFLELNGVVIPEATGAPLCDLILEIADGRRTRAEAAGELRTLLSR